MRVTRLLPWLAVVLLAIAFSLFGTGAAQAVSGVVEVTNFGSNPGNLQMFKYVPAGLPANSPLVVAMHGANSDHTLMDTTAGWEELANRFHFALAMPQQKSANQNVTAFNFNTTADATRGNGEALSIKQMVDYMKTNHNVDPARVFATGFSAGGFMTTVMLATYPDVFAAGSIGAGGAYMCTAAVSSCGTVIDKTPQAWGDIVRAQNPGYTGPWPRVQVTQGDADNLANYAWMQEIVDEWTNVHGIDLTADVSDTVKTYPHKVYNDAAGNAKVETITIPGLAHKIPVDPGTAFDQCGTVNAISSEDKNICMAYSAATWFGITGADTTPPTVNVTAPTNGATVSGTTTVTATASDNVGVTQVQVFIDGVSIGTDTTSPYSVSWDTTTVANGSRAIKAVASDAAGNTGTDNDTSVTVSNGTPTTVTFNDVDANDGYVKANTDGTSPEVGTLESTTGLAMGKSTAVPYKHMRTLLSFDTSSIPDGATITRAYITVQWMMTGGNAWTDPAGNTLVIDVKNGCLGAACTIGTDDWAASPTASAVASIPQFSSGSMASSDFGSSGLVALNKTGTTQLKLRFSQFQTSFNYVTIQPGATETLTVVYQ